MEGSFVVVKGDQELDSVGLTMFKCWVRVVLLAGCCQLPKWHMPGVLPGWQLAIAERLAEGGSTKRSVGYVKLCASYSCVFHSSHPSIPLHLHLRWVAARGSIGLLLNTSQKPGPAADSQSNRSADELEAEFDWLQVASFDTQGTNQLSKLICCRTPPFGAKLHEMYNLEEITTIRKGVTPQSATEDLMVHDQNE